ncbi:hypothetical protein ACQKPX_07555 [Photobacterium sp. DNB23_23_1]
MNKKLVALFIVSSIFSFATFFVDLKKGTQEFGLQGSLDFDYADDVFGIRFYY